MLFIESPVQASAASVDSIPKSTITQAGDIIVGLAGGIPMVVSVSDTGKLLVSDTEVTGKMSWQYARFDGGTY